MGCVQSEPDCKETPLAFGAIAGGRRDPAPGIEPGETREETPTRWHRAGLGLGGRKGGGTQARQRPLVPRGGGGGEAWGSVVRAQIGQDRAPLLTPSKLRKDRPEGTGGGRVRERKAAQAGDPGGSPREPPAQEVCGPTSLSQSLPGHVPEKPTNQQARGKVASWPPGLVRVRAVVSQEPKAYRSGRAGSCLGNKRPGVSEADRHVSQHLASYHRPEHLLGTGLPRGSLRLCDQRRPVERPAWRKGFHTEAAVSAPSGWSRPLLT